MQDIRPKHELLSVLLQAIAGFAILTLVVFGVAGTVYKVLAPGGWLAQLFGQGLTGGAAALLALMALGALAGASRAWVSHVQKRRGADLLLYAFAGVGLLYLTQLFLGGGF